jgi:KDO2-lipid IV(A) lauroyltransferase
LEAAALRPLLATKSLPVARVYARALDRFSPKLRRTAYRNLSLTMPQLNAVTTVDAVFESIARLLYSLSNFPEINATNVHQWIHYEGFEHYEAAKRRGKGVLFATAHLGNWELSAFSHALMAEPMNIVVRPLDNPLLDSISERYRGLSGNRILGKKDFLRPVLRALANNEAVGILVDQNSLPEQGVFIDFFGLRACVDSGFARLAAHSGATVLPGFALWSDREKRHILKFYPPVEITGELVRDTQAVHRAVEQAIRSFPGQWLWIHRRWKTRPPGEPPLY